MDKVVCKYFNSFHIRVHILYSNHLCSSIAVSKYHEIQGKRVDVKKALSRTEMANMKGGGGGGGGSHYSGGGGREDSRSGGGRGPPGGRGGGGGGGHSQNPWGGRGGGSEGGNWGGSGGGGWGGGYSTGMISYLFF